MLLIQIKQSDFMTATSNSYKFQEPSVQLLFLGTYFGSKERHNRVQKAEVVATLCEETKRTLTKGCKKFLGLPYGWGKNQEVNRNRPPVVRPPCVWVARSA